MVTPSTKPLSAPAHIPRVHLLHRRRRTTRTSLVLRPVSRYSTAPVSGSLSEYAAQPSTDTAGRTTLHSSHRSRQKGCVGNEVRRRRRNRRRRIGGRLDEATRVGRTDAGKLDSILFNLTARQTDGSRVRRRRQTWVVAAVRVVRVKKIRAERRMRCGRMWPLCSNGSRVRSIFGRAA